jgi:glycosyltransferase involved in cell wall biosynthesis
MKIWHVGALPSPNEVNGVNATVWQVAKGQALLDHEVTLVLDESPDEAALSLAEQVGIVLTYIPASTWRYDPKVLKSLLSSDPPQLVHMHSTYFPKQATLARQLVQNSIPFVVTPNGGLDRQSKRLKKSLYVSLVEKPRLRVASAITVVAPQEERVVRADVPDYKGVVRWVPNPVDTQSLEGYSWKEDVESKRLVFLGRFHVVHKGLDTLVGIASFMPDVEFHLYGSDDGRATKLLEQLRRRLPPNVHFHAPVFGAEKARVLANASLYIQTSRWEGFPLSIIEAMYLGVPCAITSTFYPAELFLQEDLGLVISSDPQEAAAQLSEVLTQPAHLRRWSQLSQSYAKENFVPRTVASEYLKLYEEVLLA